MICNADESEPGTFKDREILATQPHLVLEGMLLGMLAVGAEESWVFIRHEYGPEEQIIRGEIEHLRETGLIGPDAGGSGRRLSVEVFTSPGGYILGEESALIECMEGHRGEPRNKPPFPGTYGLYGKPTLMNSVETLAHVPVIAARGAPWWSAAGPGRPRGPEVLRRLRPRGTARRVLRPDGHHRPRTARPGRRGRWRATLGAIQPGGASSNFIGPDQLDVELDFGTLQAAGSMLGSGAMVVMAEGTDLLAAAVNVLRFFRDESCGKCVPCRVGSAKAHLMLADLLAGGGGPADVDADVRELIDVLRRTSICGLGQVALGPVSSVLRLAAERPRRLTPAGREFFTTRTVARGPGRVPPGPPHAGRDRTARPALRRVPAEPVTAPHPLPGFARSTVDGYAVRAADTYGVSEGLPGYLTVTGAVLMGAEPAVAVTPGTAVAMPTGGALPPGADAVVMIEYTAEAMPGTIEVVRPVAPGEGMVRADEDARVGQQIIPNGRVLRPQDLGMLAAAGVTSVRVHARPVVTIFSTGDEVVPPETETLQARPGARRDRRGAGRAGHRRRRRPGPRRHRPRRPGRPGEGAARGAGNQRHARDLGRLLGGRARRDRQRGRPARPAGDLVPRPGDQAGQAHPAGRVRRRFRRARRSGDRPARQPALRARRVPADRHGPGPPGRRLHGPPPEASTRARLARNLASATGRLDVVQVTVRAGVATPLFGVSALLSVLTAADGYVVIPEEATGLDAGTEVDVTLVPVKPRQGRQPWPTARSSATCRPRRPWKPGAPPGRRRAARSGCRPSRSRSPRPPGWSPPRRSGPPGPRRRSTRPGWTASRSGRRTRSAPARPRPCYLAPGGYDVVDTGDPMPPGRDAVVMREHVHYDDGRAELRAAVPPYQHVRSIGEDVSAGELLLPEGHRLRAGRRGGGRRRRGNPADRPAAPVVLDPAHRRRGAADRRGARAGADPRHQLADARRAGARGRMRGALPADRAGRPGADRGRGRGGGAGVRPADHHRRVKRGPGRLHRAGGGPAGTLAVHGVAVRPGHPVVLGVVGRTPVLGAPGYPVSAALTFDIFAEPLLAELAGAPPRRRPRATRPAGPQARVAARHGRLGAGAARRRRRHHGRHPAAARGRRAHLAGPRRRAARRPGRAGRPPRGLEVPVELLRGLDEISGTIVAIGSHDLVLDLAASALRADDPVVTLASSNVGSLGGLVALRDGLCHIAGSHLLDPATGEYTAALRGPVSAPPPRRVAIVRLVHRDQGLLVARRQPARHRRASTDLTRPGLRYVNRQRGAGTRVLLDHELGKRGDQPRTRSRATRARSPPTSRWRPRSRPGAPTPGSASWPPPAVRP